MTDKLPKFIGPFQVASRICPTTYLVEDILAKRKGKVWRRLKAHQCQLGRFHTKTDGKWMQETPLEVSDKVKVEELKEVSNSAPEQKLTSLSSGRKIRPRTWPYLDYNLD